MAARMKRIAATDSPEAFKRAFDQPMLLHGRDKVRAAAWRKTALWPEQRT